MESVYILLCLASFAMDKTHEDQSFPPLAGKAAKTTQEQHRNWGTHPTAYLDPLCQLKVEFPQCS